MVDQATPNLPSRDFAATTAFYAQLGFEQAYVSDAWMILDRGTVTLEFFGYPDLDPGQSSFSCCLRLDDLDALCRLIMDAGVPIGCIGWPRLHLPKVEPWGGRIAYLVDPDGTLLRLIANDRPAA